MYTGDYFVSKLAFYPSSETPEDRYIFLVEETLLAIISSNVNIPKYHLELLSIAI
jgi:hypothetical protein